MIHLQSEITFKGEYEFSLTVTEKEENKTLRKKKICVAVWRQKETKERDKGGILNFIGNNFMRMLMLLPVALCANRKLFADTWT